MSETGGRKRASSEQEDGSKVKQARNGGGKFHLLFGFEMIFQVDSNLKGGSTSL